MPPNVAMMTLDMYEMYAASVRKARVFDMVSIGTRLSELRTRSGLSLDEVAFRANYRGRSSVQKYFAASYDPPVLDRLIAARLARALVGEGSPPIVEAELLSLAGDGIAALPNYKYKEIGGLRRDVAIYLGIYVVTRPLLERQPPISLYTFEMDNPVDYYWHPPTLLEDGDIYGLRIMKRPLMPRFKPGETLIVNGTREPRLGDDVVIIFNTDNQKSKAETFDSHALGTFASLEGHNGDTMQMRSFDQETSFKVAVSATRIVHPLITADDALRS